MKAGKRKARATPKPGPALRPDFRREPLDPVPATWTDEQAVAVHDFCAVLQEIFWRRYLDALTDAALAAQLVSPPPNGDDRTRRLPFDDAELPF